jgi:hypothetical protein
MTGLIAILAEDFVRLTWGNSYIARVFVFLDGSQCGAGLRRAECSAFRHLG